MIEQTLHAMRRREKIPASGRRASLRAQLVSDYAETRLSAIQTRIGWIGIAWTPRGIVAIELPRRSRSQTVANLERNFKAVTPAERVPDSIRKELSEYAEGRRRVFDLQLDWSLVKPFQRAVLTAALKIPFGETRSYGWIAHAIGRPRAARAVGRALATNPIPLILPCHRVVGSNGSLTGYGGGLPLKKKLLEMEARLVHA